LQARILPRLTLKVDNASGPKGKVWTGGQSGRRKSVVGESAASWRRPAGRRRRRHPRPRLCRQRLVRPNRGPALLIRPDAPTRGVRAESGRRVGLRRADEGAAVPGPPGLAGDGPPTSAAVMARRTGSAGAERPHATSAEAPAMADEADGCGGGGRGRSERRRTRGRRSGAPERGGR
jgi:hypothetical protein